MPLLVHFGAGAIGRSLVGTLFTQAGYDVLFIDADARIVQALQERRGYRVVIKDALPPGSTNTVAVSGVNAIAVQNAQAVADAVANADLLGTSVGANVLPAVLRALAPGLARRTRAVSILFCENLHGVANLARATLTKELGSEFPLDERVGLVATSIGKMVPIMPATVRERDPLEVWGEAYNQIIADRQAFVGPLPNVPGLQLKDHFDAYVARKLYVHNLGHSVCAYEGFLRGHALISDAMADLIVAQATRAAMESTAAALLKRHPDVWQADEMAEHVADLLHRFGNRALGDTVHRVGRDLARKLGPDDRLAGALRLVVETGGAAAPICDAIAAALHFAAPDERGKTFPPDDNVRAQVAALGPRAFLERHARLAAKDFSAELERIDRRSCQLSATHGCSAIQSPATQVFEGLSPKT
ncbi:MAG: mannitol-1-phosphate 5-dehydrogenase [Kiritimatiellia bacterium]|jgi:mannitol-1-phosphate 5-dehydrogenase